MLNFLGMGARRSYKVSMSMGVEPSADDWAAYGLDYPCMAIERSRTAQLRP